MQPKLIPVLVASACLYSANGIAKTGFPFALPDFTISNFTYTPNLTTGNTEISLTVLNQSLESYSPQRSPLFLRMWTGTSRGDADIIINHKSIDPMGNYGSRTYSWTTPTHLLSKNLYATVDPSGIIQEINEDNNDAIAVSKDSIGTADIELESTITTDIVGGYAMSGDTVGITLATVAGSEFTETLSGILAVIDENGAEVFVSGLLPLFNLPEALSYQAYTSWDTSDVPAAAYTLTYSVWGETSGKMDEISEKIYIESLAENNAPIAKDDSATTTLNTSVDIDLQVNDIEPDGNGFNHYISGEPLHGEVDVLRGLATYTPDEGFVGSDQFSYQMNDYSGASDWAIVTVDVLPPEHGCTWIRDFEVIASAEKTAVDGWSDYELPESGRAENAAVVHGNSNPNMFDVQPFISFPSCSLYFQPKAGATGTATVVYTVLDKATEGEQYTSEARTFDITVAPEANLPEFLSTPITLVQLNQSYSYVVELSNNSAELTALELPDFLTLENGVISGTANDGDVSIGMHQVTLVVDDGVQSNRQQFLLTVEPAIATTASPFPDVLSDDDVVVDAPETDGAGAGTNVDNSNESGVVETGGSGSFNLIWLLLSLPLLRRLR